MSNPKEKITVKYKSAKTYCHCCNRPVEEPEYSAVREFDFYEKIFGNTALTGMTSQKMSWSRW